MQHPVTTPLPILPTEVVEEVIDQASDDPRSLQRLALLCKPLLTRARLHLFTGIIIRDVEHMLSSRNFLDSHPWVPPLVQRVTLTNRPNSWSTNPKFKDTAVLDMVPSHLLARFPNLRTWKMDGTGMMMTSKSSRLAFHRSALLCYHVYGRHVQELELEHIPIQNVSHFIQLVASFTHLHRLTCHRIQLWEEHKTTPLDSEILSKLSKPLKIQHLSVSILAASSMEYTQRGLTVTHFAD